MKGSPSKLTLLPSKSLRFLAWKYSYFLLSTFFIKIYTIFNLYGIFLGFPSIFQLDLGRIKNENYKGT
ncbi:hypothetical protein [Caldivirga sp. UBA161]|uniref:hypothetical protein n=1 Tax=Caldivirga sp. UBA161 TaxID=1915569 RepID=UPI0025C1440F|nr:hypothetical protein [Caldivirga sp. UBA161]